MNITDINHQVKRSDRYSVFVDGKYAFPMSETGLLNSGLHIGQEVTKAQLDELKELVVIDKGFDQSLNLIMRRPRSEWELRDYLKRKEYDSEVVDKILNMLSNRGYVNDKDFARRWVENRRLLKATSKRRLTQELRQKRVTDEIIHSVLEADETDELLVLRDLIERKQKQTKYKDNLKLMQYLVRQGYNYGDIKEVLADKN